MIRSLMALSLLMITFVMPAAAQPRVDVPDITRHAEFVPESALMYLSTRSDAAYRDQLEDLLDQMDDLLDDTPIEDFFEDLLLEDDIEDFIGDSIALAVFSPDVDLDRMLNDNSDVMVIIGVRDMAAFWDEFDGGDDRESMETRNGWTVHPLAGGGVITRGDVLIMSPRMSRLETVISGDYASLSSSERFRGAVSHLPHAHYDMLAYFDVESLATHAVPELAQLGVSGLLGQVTVGAVSVDNRDLLLDVGHRYGDLTTLKAHGFDPENMIAAPVDPTFARHVEAGTLLYAQSRGLGGAIGQIFHMLNVVGGVMENEELAAQFDLQGVVTPRMGNYALDLINGAMGAVSGLSLKTNVIEALRGDFALYFSALTPPDFPRHTPSFGLLLTEDGQGEAFHRALVNLLDRAGVPIERERLGDISALNLRAVTEPVVAGAFGNQLRRDPNVDVWFAADSRLMALGTAPSVKFAFAPTGDTLADSSRFGHSASTLFLEGAQGIAYADVAGLEVLADMPDLTDTIEIATASYRADALGFVGRLTLTLRTDRRR